MAPIADSVLGQIGIGREVVNGCSPEPDDLADARAERDRARRQAWTLRRALGAVATLHGSSLEHAIDQVLVPFSEASQDACTHYERAVEQRDERIRHLELIQAGQDRTRVSLEAEVAELRSWRWALTATLRQAVAEPRRKKDRPGWWRSASDLLARLDDHR
jgi:hypothetical protein